MDLIKSTYEISIWQDIPATENDIEYLDEQRLATIGSNTMTSPARALSPSLRENVNGTKTLTFMMYTNYYDEDSDKMVSNPFINLLVNERKVKLREGGELVEDVWEDGKLVEGGWEGAKWYDFVITNIQENSENNSFTYTATDLHINELAKNGFNLEFDNELENNQGTVEELAEKVLEGTDWTVEKGDKICQYKYEPVYQWTLTEENTYTFVKLEKKENEDDVTRSEGGYIYVFYSSKEDNEPYCIFNEDFSQINTTETLTYEKYPTYQLKNTENIDKNTVVEPFQAERLIDSIKSGYDVKIDKYYNVYTKDDTEYHCYSKTDFISPETVQELIVGGNDFTSTAGWSTQVDSELTFEGIILPEVNEKNIKNKVNFDSYLRVVFPTGTDTQDTDNVLFNEGIYINSDIIGGFNVGDTYYVDLSGYWDANQKKFFNEGTINVHIYETNDSETDDSETDEPKTEIWDGYVKNGNNDTPRAEAIREQTDSNGVITEKKVWRYTFKFTKPLSLEDLKTKKYKIGFTCGSEKEYTRYFDFISFFKEVKTKVKTEEGEKEKLIYPEDVLGIDDSYAITKYYIYNPTNEYESLDDLTYEYVGEEIPNDYMPVSNNFEKIRSISAKESNRYNLIQTLAETFQCWARFEIEHDENTGKIKLDKDNKKPIKKVSFHNYVNDDYNYAGFKKGINLSSTTRDIASDQIVSKLIVKNNANEFATDGFCSIARSKENYTQENYLYNFDYYISHGLIDSGKLFADLYSNSFTVHETVIDETTQEETLEEKELTGGYYGGLRSINLLEEPLIQKMSEVATVITNLEAQLQTSQLAYEAAKDEKVLEQNKLKTYCGLNYEDIKKDPSIVPAARWDDNTFKDIITQIKICEQTYNLNHEQYVKVENKLKGFNDEYEKLKAKLEEYAEQKEELNKKFFSKYSRFIKEGTWISEDYYDDDLYYLDSEKVLFESAYPKVSYTIQVMDLSKIEEFENYKFELGQKSFIEDTDFFGWYLKNGILTPRQEEIIVSEIIRYFEEPERNIITVQNYKARFDELFQRITATTQSLQYHSGEYGRAANVVETSGEIKYDTLQNSIANNALIIKNAKDQSVVIGDNGITVTNLSRPNEIVRIVSGGVLLSNDGGQNYGSAIRGSGINANYITAGQINAERVNIMMGNYPSFKWDSRGINAFYWDTTNDIAEFNTNQFVRFDRFGLYGCNLSEGAEFTPDDLEDVKLNALFGLTWDGFFLKSNSSENGRIEITSKQDIKVIKNDVNRVELGLLEGEEGEEKYGLRLRDNADKITLEAGDDGKLWLRDRLNVEVSDSGNNVGIGTLDVIDDEHKREVINATNNFIVYEDGYMKATGGEFTGVINATGGKIGNLSITEINNELEGITIQSLKGDSFKIGNETVSPESLLLEASLKGVENINNSNIRWFGSNNFEDWSFLGSGQNYTLTYETFEEKQALSTYFIKVEYDSYIDYITIRQISDGIQGPPGEPGKDANSFQIKTSQEEILKFYEKQYNETEEIDLQEVGIEETILSITPENLSIELIETNSGNNQNIDSIQYSIVTSDGTQQDYTDFGEYLDIDNSTDTKKIIKIKELVNNFKIIKEEGEFYVLKTLDAFIIIKINNAFIKPISCRFGTSDKMAKFALHATDITAAIDNTKLKFDTNGLTIQNGGISILNNEGVEVFSTDDDGNLIISGRLEAATGSFKGVLEAATGSFAGDISAATGTFSGRLEASEGFFEGDISAASGTIGGFTISKDELVSSDGGVVLNGTNGEIKADKIKLGTGATIEDYLEIGNAKIYNPSENNNNLFIESEGIKIYDNGTANFGDISIDGKNSTIYGNNWNITHNKATFDNIDVTGTIHAAAFEYGKTQVVGGSMLFKTSAKIEEVNDNSVTINNTDGFDINSIVYIPNIDLVCKINSINNKILTLDTEENLTGSETIIVLANYNENNNLVNNYLIGVNSGDGRQGKFLYGRGLTLSEISEENGWEGKLKVFLGDLNSLNKPDVKGYGLYGENVFLTGSLTTQIEPGSTYAGINTLSPVYTTSNERIVLWAGANSNTDDNIKNAPFQVTQDGSIYANKGTFNGALITESIIQGADLYAARLHGGTEGSAAPLNIYDAGQGEEKGIVFWKNFVSEEDKGTKILKINETGFYYKDNTSGFIELSDNSIKFKGNELNLTESLILEKLKISAKDNIIGYNIDDEYKSHIIFNENELNIKQTENSNIIINSNSINLNHNELIDLKSSKIKIQETLSIGEKVTISLINSKDGFDIYIA